MDDVVAFPLPLVTHFHPRDVELCVRPRLAGVGTEKLRWLNGEDLATTSRGRDFDPLAQGQDG